MEYRRATAAVQEREAPATAILQGLAERPGVTLVDPVAAICGETCPNVREGQLLYRDGNHISTYASETFVPRTFEGVEF